MSTNTQPTPPPFQPPKNAVPAAAAPQLTGQPVAPGQPTSPDMAAWIAAVEKSNRTKLIWGLVCLLGPTALFFASIIIYTVMAIFTAGGGTSAASTIANVIGFLIGAVVVLTWLPGIIVGIILLATRQKIPPQQ